VNRHPSVPIVTPQRNWRPIAVLLATILSTAVTALGAATDTATVVRKNVAVINLKAAGGLTQADAELITDHLNTDLFKTGRINLLERAQINDILKEQGFQNSGACTDEACLVQMGQVLGVEEIITGSIGKLGGLFLVNLRSIDVANGKIITILSEDVPGSLEEVVKYLPGIARELVGLERGPTPGAPAKPADSPDAPTPAKPSVLRPSKNAGTIVVESIPLGSAVTLNGKAVGVTPYIDNKLVPGNYKVAISAPHHATYATEYAAIGGEVKRIVADLSCDFGRLVVLSQPEKARAFFDGKLRGETPLTIDTIYPKTYAVELRLQGYRTLIEQVVVAKDTTDTLSYALFTTAHFDSARVAQRRASLGKRMARRVVFGVLAGGAWGTGIYFNKQASLSIDKEKKLWALYNETPTHADPVTAAEFEQRYSDYKHQTRVTDRNRAGRAVFYSVGGVFSIPFVISVFF